ncbi:MAG: InlB B-repeat-containing protein [Kiritimatiellae bacterium]|nr:InlB B-repeat-containing protein [Kiritimatiellia bacterium]
MTTMRTSVRTGWRLLLAAVAAWGMAWTAAAGGAAEASAGAGVLGAAGRKDGDALSPCVSPEAARLAALRQGKLLFLQMGAEWCGPCLGLREYLKSLGTAFSGDYVFCYLDTDKDACGFDDGTFSGIPAWAVIDPRRFNPAERWASGGILHEQAGYSVSSVSTWLDHGRAQWKTLGAAPAALVASAPATLALPKALSAFLRFPDGTECDVSGAVSWSLASGTAATLSGNTLIPAGSSGEVAVRCEGTFWNRAFDAGATVRVIGGATLAGIEIQGPAVFDLYDESAVQYTAVAVLSDGSRAEVDAEWSADTPGKANYLQCSEDGRLSFSRNTYTVQHSVTVTVHAASAGIAASRDILVHGPGYVRPVGTVFSQNALWPGAEVELVPQKVQWWRHGVLEPPTDDFTDVEFRWEMYCPGSGSRSGDGPTVTVPADAESTNSYAYVYLNSRPARERYYNTQYDYMYMDFQSSPAPLLAVDFDAGGGTVSVPRILRATGTSLGALPEATRPGHLFDGWFRRPDGAKVTASTTVSNAFACTAKWLQVVSVDLLGPSAAAEPSKFALSVALDDGTARTVTNGVAWALVSGDAASIAADGTLTPLPGKTGDVQICATAVVAGGEYRLCKTVRILSPSDVRSLRVEGPDLIDLYDVPGGLYRAYVTTASGEYEVAPAWTAEGIGASYMQISPLGELSFSYNTYTVYQCATALVTAACCGLTNTVSTLLYGPGYVTPVSFTLSQNALWPGAEMELVPQKVQWWRHGVLEPPTDDFTDVEFSSWEVYCPGYGWHAGNGTTITVPADAVFTNGTTSVYLYTQPARERYYRYSSGSQSLHFLDAAPARWVTVSFDANGGETACTSVRYLPGQPYRFLPALSRKGYSGSWYTEASGGSPVTASSNAPAANATLHARWTANYYWITFDANGGEGSMSDQRFYYDTPATLRKNTFTMEGDSFAGWALSPDGEAVFADGAQILNLRDDYDEITLYAVWPKTTYVDIAFDPNGGAVGEKRRRTALGRPIRTLPLPVRPGHAFAGWYTAPEGGAHVRRGMAVPGPATLWAHWAEGEVPSFTDLSTTNAAAAIEAAVAADKLLFVLHGADWCGYCAIVKRWLAARWAEVGQDFVVYYCNGDYDDTIYGSYPQYGVFDPSAFAGNWQSGCHAYVTGGSDSLVENLVTDALRAAGRLGEWGSVLAPVSDGATAAEVEAAIVAAGFADPGVARAVGGRAATFNALVDWASSVKDASGAAPAGASAVIADSHAAAAFLLGAERLFADAPSIAFESLAVPRGGALAVILAVRDSAGVVPVSAGKVGSLLESADSPAAWTDAPSVESSSTDAEGRLHLSLAPANPASATRGFLRLRK